ncbi:MAG: sulfotransferase family protein [Myxococcota bacterium]
MPAEAGGPHFIGIGSSRCGTTFLHAALRRHPEIWLPPVKELHFFDRGGRRRRRARGRGTGSVLKATRRMLRGDRDGPADVRFLLRHRFGAHDLAAYRAWFRLGAGRVCGEITPGYCILEDERIALIRRELPDLRLIFLMRDPIDRAWSAAYKSLVRDRGRSFDAVAPEEWRRKIESRGLARRSDYPGILDRWERHFPAEQIRVGFFEDLQAAPEAFLREIHLFLGVAPRTDGSWSTSRGRNASGSSACPPELEALLAAQFLDMNRRLHERFGSHATAWYHRAQRVLDRDSRSRSAAAPDPC